MTLAVVGYYEAWWIQVVKAIVIFAVGLQLVPVVLLAERKLLGRMQARYGPNRVGPFGALQPLADIVKLLTKEQFRPSTSIGFLFALAPVVSIVTAVAAFAIIPFGNVAAHLRYAGGAVWDRRVDRPAVPVRVRRRRLLRDHARRLVLGLEVLLPRRDERSGAADLLRGLPGAWRSSA